MSIMSKLTGGKKSAESQKKAQQSPKEEQKPMERQVYIPRHAARDAMACAPPTWKDQDRQNVIRENQQRARLSRSTSEMSSRPMSMTPAFPKAISRSSSSHNMDWNAPSFQAGPSSNSSSVQSLRGIAQDGPPVPAIPAQYASQSPSVGPSSLAHSRNSSFQKQANYQATDSFSRPRNSRSCFSQDMHLGKSPLQTYENSPVESETSSTSSVASSEIIEMRTLPRNDSGNMNLDAYNQLNKGSPRSYMESPITPIYEDRPEKRYFGHPASAKPATAPIAAPMPQKKTRFSFARKSQAIAAY